MKDATSADLRALRATYRVRLYDIAAEAGIAPTTLVELLNERRALDPARASRIREAIERIAAQRPPR